MVVGGVVTHFALNSNGASEVRKLGENVVDWCTGLTTLTPGVRELASSLAIGRCSPREVSEVLRRCFVLRPVLRTMVAQWRRGDYLCDAGGIDRNLVVCSDWIDLRENARTRELVGVVMYVSDGVAVGNGSGVQRSIVSAGTPIVVLLGQDVKWGGSRTLGVAGCAIPQHGVEFRFGNSEPVRC
jgi:hypothetical protein